MLDAVVGEHLLAPPVRRVALRGAAGDLLNESGLTSAGGEHGIRSVLALPLTSKGQVLGTLNLGHDAPTAYAEGDLGVLRPVAESLAAAIENARLYEEVQRSSAVASALLRTGEALSRLVPADQLLEEVASRAVSLRGADDALIFLLDEERQRFVLRASAGVVPENLTPFQRAPSTLQPSPPPPGFAPAPGRSWSRTHAALTCFHRGSRSGTGRDRAFSRRWTSEAGTRA